MEDNMTKPTHAEMGRITSSNGEYDAAQVIRCMAAKLRGLLRHCRVPRENRKRFTALLQTVDETFAYNCRPTDEYERELTERLNEALSHFAPPHARFGEQDGEWGYWPKLDDDLPRLSRGKNIDAYVDRPFGVACVRFDRRGRCHEYWSTV
jgi:hypothetical protein